MTEKSDEFCQQLLDADNDEEKYELISKAAADLWIELESMLDIIQDFGNFRDTDFAEAKTLLEKYKCLT